MPPFIDLSGKRFGKWTVVARAADGNNRQPRWTCRCDCGTTATVFGISLRQGTSQPCGCLRLSAISTHGKTGTTEFTVWQMMRQRCNNPNSASYHSYGGRGITVCERWDTSFANFLADMGPRPKGHTLERRDNDGPYSPENCHWATPMEQGRNKRTNRRLTMNGETHTIMEWCRLLGMRKTTLLNRLKRMPTHDALTRPVAHKRST